MIKDIQMWYCFTPFVNHRLMFSCHQNILGRHNSWKIRIIFISAFSPRQLQQWPYRSHSSNCLCTYHISQIWLPASFTGSHTSKTNVRRKHKPLCPFSFHFHSFYCLPQSHFHMISGFQTTPKQLHVKFKIYI